MRDAFGDQLRAAQAERELADVGDALRRFAEENGFNPELGARELLAKAAGSFRSCSAMSDARYDEIRRLRAEIEAMRPRLMPEGMEWPRTDEDKPVVLGDELIDDDGAPGWREVDQVSFYRIGDCIEVSLENSRGVTDSYCMGERVKRPAPKALDADGVPIRVGDTVYALPGDWCNRWPCFGMDAFRKMTVETLTNGRNDGSVTCRSGCLTCYPQPSQLTHRAPVLAADGLPLREGETVYCDGDGGHVVDRIEYEGGGTPNVYFTDETWAYPDLVTHERPEIDSWERLEEDADKNPFDYCKGVGHKLDTCENSEAYKSRDIVRRAKALAGDA